MRVRSLEELPLAMRKQLSAEVGAKDAKYRNERVEEGGIKFDSKLEARRYRELLTEQAAGLIRELEVHVPFALHVTAPNGARIRVGSIEVDFKYVTVCDAKLHLEDTKSAPTRRLEVYRLKRKMLEAEYGLELVEITRTGVR